MFETTIQCVGKIIRCTFIPVLYAAPKEVESIQNDKLVDRLKVAVKPG